MAGCAPAERDSGAGGNIDAALRTGFQRRSIGFPGTSAGSREVDIAGSTGWSVISGHRIGG